MNQEINQEIKYIALVPAYEPDNNLPRVVKELQENNFDVVVVNDGSSLDYKEFFDACNTKKISYPTNRGKGYALKKGYEYIKENYNNYIVVTIDSDGQHKVEDAKNLCEYVKNNMDTLVIGKRLRKDNVPLRSMIGNTITKFVFNLATGLDIYDTQSGLRAFSNKLIDYMLEIEGERFEYEMNVLLNLNQKNIKHKEIEIQTIYIDNNKKSHFKTISDSFKIYGKIAEFKVKPLVSFFMDLVIFAALIIATNKIITSNLISKTISLALYYIINIKEIFKEKPKLKNILFQLLTIIIYIIVSTFLIIILSKIINKYTSKVIIELLLFIIIQKIKNKLIIKTNKTNNDIIIEK